jgi:hypothetical protein
MRKENGWRYSELHSHVPEGVISLSYFCNLFRYGEETAAHEIRRVPARHARALEIAMAAMREFPGPTAKTPPAPPPLQSQIIPAASAAAPPPETPEAATATLNIAGRPAGSVTEFRRRFEPHVGEIVETLLALMRSPNENTRLAACREILDLVNG